MGIVEGIIAVFNNWKYVMQFIHLFQGTPEQHREALMQKMQAESDALKTTGRPTW